MSKCIISADFINKYDFPWNRNIIQHLTEKDAFEDIEKKTILKTEWDCDWSGVFMSTSLNSIKYVDIIKRNE